MTHPAKDFPKFRAKHIHKGDYDGPNNTHCALGWARRIAATEIDVLFHHLRSLTGYRSISDWNDDPATSKATIARALNRAVAAAAKIGVKFNRRRFPRSAGGR